MARKTPDLSHLTKACKEHATLPAQDRIDRIKKDKWIGYSRAKEALLELDDTLSCPKKQRMPNLLIIGPTNNGKSMLVEKFRRRYPAKETGNEFPELEVTMPVVCMQMPPDPSVARFYGMLIKSTGAYVRASRSAELEQIALNRLNKVGAKMLVIDELHNVLAGQSDVRREFLNIIRFLGNELRIPIVAIGIRDAYLTIRSDDQLENRFKPITLPKWEEGEEFLSLLASFEASLPLQRASEIATAERARYILEKTEGTIGEIAKFLMMAATKAIRTGEERMNAKVFSLVEYQSPSERRRTFERQLQ